MSEGITVYAVSDMTGTTVGRIVRAASAQFPAGHVSIKVLSHAISAEQIVGFIQRQGDDRGPCAVFHTILAKRTREDLRNALQTLRIPSIDLLGSTAHVMADLLGDDPQETPGLTIDDGVEPVVFDLASESVPS
ncbi:MAG: kinase/pyrophosphorylase [Atopobiaceae bacterium]|nr:kinase/pyrophosphorylase [Atopobiaceae bacterium]